MSSAIFKSPLPYLALLLSHLIWGGNFVVAKITLQEFPPSSLAFLRFGLAALFLIPFFLTETKKTRIHRRDLAPLVGIGVLMITLNISFFFAGITKTTAINASTLTLVIPMLSVLLSWILLKEKVYLINLLGIALGLSGALIIIGLPEIIFGQLDSEILMGNVLILLAATSWVVGSILSRRMLKVYSSLSVTAFAFFIGAATFLLPAVSEYLKNPLWPSQVTILGIVGLIYMTMLSSISGYFLFEWGLAKTSVDRANLFQYVEPAIAAILAILILGETVNKYFMTGAVLIAAGLYLGTLGKEVYHHHKLHRV
ncbi:MAG: EamA family transporter [Candidatus Daviesbacteria bacterium]|nr:MAG: EamA family transporter [Candidatus Daviesbacteria bacterium]